MSEHATATPNGNVGLGRADGAYANVSLPTVRGRRTVERLAQAMLGRAAAGVAVPALRARPPR